MSERVVVLADYRKPQEPEVPRDPVIEITIYANGDETLWVADQLETAEQFNWAITQIAECLAALLRTKHKRTGMQ